MPKLTITKEIACFIVVRLALGETPQTVADMVKAEFDFEISRQCVNRYNPAANPRLHSSWKYLFDRTRADFLKKIENIPMAHKSWRLKELQRIFYKLESEKIKNEVQILAVLEQAAKESGDFYQRR